jgi:hypothetical protein
MPPLLYPVVQKPVASREREREIERNRALINLPREERASLLLTKFLRVLYDVARALENIHSSSDQVLYL